MPIFTCPSCGVKLQIPEENWGRQVRCPRCQHIFQPAQAMPSEPWGPAPPPLLSEDPPASEHVMARQENYPWPASQEDDFTTAPFRPRSRRNEEDEEYEDREDRYRRRLLLRTLPGMGVARASTILILAILGLDLIGLVINFVYFHQLQDMVLQPGFGEMRDVENIEMILGLVGILQMGIYIASVVVFSMWIYRASANLRWLGVRGCQYSPGWAVGYFFVPILNLFRPLQVVQEIWRASHPQVPQGDISWREKSGSALAGLWWTFWLISNITANIGIQMALTKPPSLEILKSGVIVEMVSGATHIPAGILVILIINGIMKLQAEKLENLGGEEEEEDFED